MISLFNWDTNDIVRGTISPINNGTFLGLFIIPSISLFIYYQKSPKRHLYLFCFILILIGLISTGRRGSYFPSLLMIFVFLDRKSTRLNSSHVAISYAVFCLKK